MIFFNLLINSINLVECISCLDEHGKQVDYYIGYKLPKLEKSKDDFINHGVRYIYMTSNNHNKWIESKYSINDGKSLLGATLKPVLKQSSQYNIILYNDQKPTTRTRPTSTGAHAKGVFASYGKSGFWLLHSIPQFPVQDSVYEYPKRSLNNGQAFLCITLNLEDRPSMENLAKHLMMMQPNIYGFNLTKAFTDKFGSYGFSDLKNRRKSSREHHLVLPIYSANRFLFTAFSKSKKFNRDLYSKLMAPFLQEDLLVQTWRNGAGEVLGSDCRDKYKIIDVESIKFNNQVKWKFSEDHAKWAVSTDSKKHHICIADINRMKSQFLRGGGGVCFQSAKIWSTFRSIIGEVEGCPAVVNKAESKSKFPGFNWLTSLTQRAWRKIEDGKLMKCVMKRKN